MNSNDLTLEITKLEEKKKKVKSKIQTYWPKVTLAQKRTISRYLELIEESERLLKLNKEIELCIQVQKQLSLTDSRISAMNQIGKLERWIKWKPARRFYYFQEMLSDKKDYLELETEERISIEKENELIRLIIINPLKITDAMLEHAWLMTESYNELSYDWKIKYKLSRINQLKSALTKTIPLRTEWNISENTWRIVVSQNTWNHLSYWNILLFQESMFWERIMLNFNDIYSFARSQRHSLDSLKEKEKDLVSAFEFLRRSDSWVRKRETRNIPVFELITKTLWKYNNRLIKEIVSHLKQIKFINTREDLKHLKKAVILLERRVKEIQSQISNIEKQINIINKKISENEGKWKNFKTNFKNTLSKLEWEDTDKIIDTYIAIEKKLEINNRLDISEIMKKIRDRLAFIETFSIEEEAKKQAYFWYEEDKKEWKPYINSKEYREHQYFEALKQKQEYKLSYIQENEDMIFELKNILNSYSNDKKRLIDTLYSVLKMYLLWKDEFTPKPYIRIYNKLYWELKNIEKAISKWNIIWIYRSLLSIKMTIKEQDFYIILWKLEDIDELKYIKENESIRKKYSWIIWKIINNINERTFLKNVKFNPNSLTYLKFKIFTKILSDIKNHIDNWDYEWFLNYIKNVKKSNGLLEI